MPNLHPCKVNTPFHLDPSKAKIMPGLSHNIANPTPTQVELSKWVGPETLRSCVFDKMRDAMKSELEGAMAEVAGVKPKAERKTRKEAAKLAVAPPVEEATAGGGAAAATPMEVDEEMVMVSQGCHLSLCVLVPDVWMWVSCSLR